MNDKKNTFKTFAHLLIITIFNTYESTKSNNNFRAYIRSPKNYITNIILYHIESEVIFHN